MDNFDQKALLIGIDGYEGNPLASCCNHARLLGGTLIQNHDRSANYAVQLAVSSSEDLGLRKLRTYLREFLQEPIKNAIIYLSGHANITRVGTFFVCHDEEELALNEILDLVNESKIPQILLLLDCCYSGNAGNMAGIELELAILRKGVAVFSSSSRVQPSLQSNGRNLFTHAILDALHGEAADILGNVTISSVYNYVVSVSFNWAQSPVFKAHLDDDLVLRRSAPKIHPEKIRKLAHYFSYSDEYPLDPSYEKTSATRAPEKVSCFEDLQAFRDVGLVIPDGAPSLYEAAMRYKRCRLTARGRFYRDLIRQKRI
jgi:hypothetical protein